MKTNFLENWKVVLVLAALPVVTAILQTPGSVNNAVAGENSGDGTTPVPIDQVAVAVDTNQSITTNAIEAVAFTNAVADTNVALVIKPSAPTLPDLKFTPGAKELIQLAQAGVGEDVMHSYITNSRTFFSLGADEIIYLNDLGLSTSLITAMIQHDSALGNFAATNVLATMPVTAMPEPEQQPVQPVPETVMTTPDYVDNGYPTVDYGTPQDTVYFYDSLAPYGSWVPVAGYGLCWQPTVCARNPGWRPYCDNGRWIYSDCGWYWQSSYSWGWAAFHYGRWYCDTTHGWVWCPNRTWGPAWVSWRQTADHCGWAPLPPGARFAAGVGLTFHNQPAAAGFGYGLGAGMYTFIPIARMTDYTPSRYVVSGATATRVFNQATVVNSVTMRNNNVFNAGVSPTKVENAAHVPVRRAVIHETQIRPNSGPVTDRLETHGNTLTIVRPTLPESGSKGGGRANGTVRVSAGTPVPGVPAASSPAKSATTPSATSANRSRVEVFKRPDAATTPAPSKTILLPNTTTAPKPAASGEKVASSSTTPVPDRKPRVEVYQRSETQPPKATVPPLILPKPSVAENTPAKPEVYPPNSIVLMGPKSATQTGNTAQRSAAEIYHQDTSFTVKIPRSTFESSSPAQSFAPQGNANRSSADFSQSGQSSDPPGFNLGRGQGRGGANAGFVNSSSAQDVPRAAQTQSRNPILLPNSSVQSSSSYNAPVNPSVNIRVPPAFQAPAFQAPVSSPVRQQSAPVLLPQPVYSAPAPAAAPAPAPARSSPVPSGGNNGGNNNSSPVPSGGASGRR